MEARKVLAVVVGTAQGLIGALAVILSYALYYDFLDVQTMLNVSKESLPIYLLILIFSGFFSIINGSFLVHEWLESRSQETR